METLELVIEAFVRENGGAEKLIYLIESEWCKSFTGVKTGVHWTNQETIRLLQLFPRHSTRYIAQVMNKTPYGVERKISRLRERCMLDYKKHHKI